MGTSSSQNHIPNNYTKISHPELKHSTLNKSTNLLEVRVKPGLGLSNWGWNLSPLEPYRKWLYMPVRFTDPELEKDKNSGWCRPSDSELYRDPVVIAEYEPYVYTLENQILTRKMNNRHFKEDELWKLVRVGVKAIQGWSHAYPDITISNPLTPRSILINPQGNIKVVHRFSFIQQSEQQSLHAYFPPPSPIASQPYQQQTPQSLSIYSLGVTLLDTVTLAQSQYSGMSTLLKKQYLNNSNIYPLEIKQTILGMVVPDPQQRVDTGKIAQYWNKYKRASKDYRVHQQD